MREIRRASGRKGFTTVYVTLTALVLVPVVGLAIDFSVLYNVKARLQPAVDAAAIGIGSMLERSTDLTNLTQLANIKDSALRFFNANYPNQYWGSTQVYYDSTPSEDGSRTRTIYVHAAYDVPMLFLRVLGVSTAVAGKAHGRKMDVPTRAQVAAEPQRPRSQDPDAPILAFDERSSVRLPATRRHTVTCPMRRRRIDLSCAALNSPPTA